MRKPCSWARADVILGWCSCAWRHAGGKPASEKSGIANESKKKNIPQGLKPAHLLALFGTTEVMPCYRARFDTSFFAACKAGKFRATFSLICILLAGQLLAAQNASAPAVRSPYTAQDGAYRIAGTVVSSTSGQPLYHATVAVLSEEDSHTIAAVESDNEGHFALEHLASAKYQLTASKRGYRTAFFDEHELYNSAVVTGPEQDTSSLTFKLDPGAILHGTVTTEGGDAVENARVMLFLQAHTGKTGGRIAQSESVTTDDTGAYEFSSLTAGDYLLAVMAEPWYAMHSSRMDPPRNRNNASAAGPPAALDVAYPITYFDSTTDEGSATHIALASGGRDQADIVLHAVAAVHILVDTPHKQDGSIARAELRQTVFGNVVGAESAGFVDSMASGATEFTGVSPGHYELVQGDPPRSVDIDATASMQIDPTLGTASVSVRGTIRNIAGAAAADCNLILTPVDSARAHGQTPTVFSNHGAFTFADVPAGVWQMSIEESGKHPTVTSIAVSGRAHSGNVFTVQDKPLTIAVTIGEGSTRVQGFAKRDGKGVAGVMVVLVPAETTALEVTARRDQSDSDGSFSLRDVVAGRYTLVAIEDGWVLDWAEPAVIARYLPGGVPVTVSDDAGKLVTVSTAVPVQTR